MERPYHPLTVESRRRKLLREVTGMVVYPLLSLTLVPIYRLKVEGRERLQGPAISVMNHCIHMEWFFLWYSIRSGYIRFTAEQANMQRRDLGWFNYFMGVLGIPNDSPMAVAPSVAAALERGELVHFFPEGVLHLKNQNPGSFMIGAAWFACRHDVPLIPVAEILTHRRIERLFSWWPPKVSLLVGKAIHPEEYRVEGEKLRDTAQRISDSAEKFIRDSIQEYGNR